VDQLATDHLSALRAGDLASQVRLLRVRMLARTLSPERAALAARIGDRASQRALGIVETGPSFAGLETSMRAPASEDVKARALIAMARCRVAAWYREQDALICDAADRTITYDSDTLRVGFTPPLGVCTLLERPYYKDYSVHYVLRTGGGTTHPIRTWNAAGEASDWVELERTERALDPRTLTGLSVRNASWIRTDQDMTVATDSEGWVRVTWLSAGGCTGTISTDGGDETVRLDGLSGPDEPAKVVWAAEKCVLCPCRLHALVCVCLDQFACSWRSRWSALTGACLAAAELVPSEQQLIERWPWPYPTLGPSGDLPASELDAVVKELSVWALGLGDPVAEDVERLERVR
jgi:hypothetical protein